MQTSASFAHLNIKIQKVCNTKSTTGKFDGDVCGFKMLPCLPGVFLWISSRVEGVSHQALRMLLTQINPTGCGVSAGQHNDCFLLTPPLVCRHSPC